MWILLGGTFRTGGLVACGPFNTEVEAETAMDAMKEMYDLGTCPEFWCFEVTLPDHRVIPVGEIIDTVYAGVCLAIVFDGDITRNPWRFFGPFRDIEAARQYASKAGGCAINLKPVPVMESA
jgi:hypothetical protein